RSLRNDQVRIALQPPQNFQPVPSPLPQRSENRQLQASLAQLHLPLVPRLQLAPFHPLHATYYAIQDIVLSTATRGFALKKNQLFKREACVGEDRVVRTV